MREVGLRRAVGVHHVDVAAEIGRPAGGERDPASIVRPVGSRVVARHVSELSLPGPVRLHQEELEAGPVAVTGQCDELAGEAVGGRERRGQ